MNRFEDELRRAAGAGAPSTPTGLGARLVARGRRRRTAGRATAGTAALLVAGMVAVGVADLGTRSSAPVVTNPIDGAPSPTPSTSTSTEVGAQAQPDPEPTPTLPVALPTGDPSPEPSGSPAPSSSPSPRPSSSSSEGEPADDGTNPGATDTGVTTDTITIATLGAETGATPSDEWMSDARRAMEAFALYAAEEMPLIHGRDVEVIFLDTRYDPNSARQVAREACVDAFAMVGSALWVDESEAVADFADSAECPDLRAEVPTLTGLEGNPWLFQLGVKFPAEPSPESWWLRQDRLGGPEEDVIGAWVRLDGEIGGGGSGGSLPAPLGGGGGEPYAPRPFTYEREEWVDREQEVSSREGFDWVVDHLHPRGDTNWSSVANEIREGDVRYLRQRSNPTDVIRLAQAMQTQGHVPALVELDAELYVDELVQAGGYDLKGHRIALDHLPWQDRGSSPVLDRYLSWLAELDPGAVPTSLGLKAWASAELFVEAARVTGPELTREAFRDYLDHEVRTWDADGALVPRPLQEEFVPACVAWVVADPDAGGWRRDNGRPGTFTC